MRAKLRRRTANHAAPHNIVQITHTYNKYNVFVCVCVYLYVYNYIYKVGQKKR